MKYYEDWEFNCLGIRNYKKDSFKKYYFDNIVENIDSVEGDIVEIGTYQGRSLLATALLLKELGSDKIVYGFDSFSGFPPEYSKYDNIQYFDELYKAGSIDKVHYDKIQHFKKISSLRKKCVRSADTSSTSEDFSDAELDLLKEKIDFLGLDNIVLVKGFFQATLTQEQEYPKKIMAALIDCDLYESYQCALPFVWGRMSIGGYMFIDEYYSFKFPGARLATDEFFSDKLDKPRRHVLKQYDFERWFVRKSWGQFNGGNSHE